MAKRSRYCPPQPLPSPVEAEKPQAYGMRYNPESGYIELTDEKGRFAGIYLPDKTGK